MSSEHDGDYYPTMRTWDYDRSNLNGSTFDILDKGDDGQTVRIATLTVRPEFAPTIARRILYLVVSAPSLWAELRELNRWELSKDLDDLRNFHRVTELLWQAGSERPYDVAADSADDSVCIKRSALAVKSLRDDERGGGDDAK